jgi:uncharacterized protein (DUF302 family)
MTAPVLRYRVPLDFTATEAALRQALQAEGFGILTEVDVSAVLKQKLGVKIRPHKLLGACNPRIAHVSIVADPDIAAYLPCGVSLREGATSTETIVTVQNPTMITESFQVEALAGPAGEAARLLQAALSRIGAAVPREGDGK